MKKFSEWSTEAKTVLFSGSLVTILALLLMFIGHKDDAAVDGKVVASLPVIEHFFLVKDDVPVAVEVVWMDGKRLDRGITVIETKLKGAGWEEREKSQFIGEHQKRGFIAAVDIVFLGDTVEAAEKRATTREYVPYRYDMLYFDRAGNPIGRRQKLDEHEVIFHLNDFIGTLSAATKGTTLGARIRI